ncbi:MAG: hypothetical protein KAT71_00590, partial [Gammaproteobacteria bacterium]|nr:hypothetical protein [Gammaproteobacteria bacterium]
QVAEISRLTGLNRDQEQELDRLRPLVQQVREQEERIAELKREAVALRGQIESLQQPIQAAESPRDLQAVGTAALAASQWVAREPGAPVQLEDHRGDEQSQSEGDNSGVPHLAGAGGV